MWIEKEKMVVMNSGSNYEGGQERIGDGRRGDSVRRGRKKADGKDEAEGSCSQAARQAERSVRT